MECLQMFLELEESLLPTIGPSDLSTAETDSKHALIAAIQARQEKVERAIIVLLGPVQGQNIVDEIEAQARAAAAAGRVEPSQRQLSLDAPVMTRLSNESPARHEEQQTHTFSQGVLTKQNKAPDTAHAAGGAKSLLPTAQGLKAKLIPLPSALLQPPSGPAAMLQRVCSLTGIYEACLRICCKRACLQLVYNGKLSISAASFNRMQCSQSDYSFIFM